MSTLKRQITEIPLDKVNGIEKMFGRLMNMDVDNIPTKYKKAFDKSRDLAYQNFKMICLYESFGIDSIKKDTIILKNGKSIKSGLLTEIFGNSSELVFFVVTLHGYDEIDAAEENMFMKLLLDSWGTGFIECGSAWAEKYIALNLEKEKLYTTNSFSPGQNDIPIEMQTDIFHLIDPEEIGVTLSDKLMMHPKKSVSGISGITKVKEENSVRPCDICERRDKCPTAYAGKIAAAYYD